jgi:O-antigen/teichoic acid export membrane protein
MAVCGIMTLIFLFTGSVPDNLILHVLLLSVIASISTTNSLILLAQEKIILYNLANLLQIAINFAIFGLITFWQKSPTVGQFILSLYVAYALGFFFTTFNLLRIWRGMEHGEASQSLWTTFKSITQYGIVSQLGNVIQYLNYKLSYYIINHYGGPADVGVYHVGITLSESVWMLSNSISLVLYSKIANIGDTEYSRDLTVKLAKFSFAITLACVLAMLLIPTSVISFVFGKDFTEVHSIMVTLSTGIALFGFSVIISHYFAGTGRYHVNTMAALLGLLVTVSGNFLLVPKIGFLGAGATASISFFTTASFVLIVFFKVTHVKLSAFKVNRKELQSIFRLLLSKTSKASS